MPSFKQHTPSTAPADAKPLLEGVTRKLGFIPNLFATFAESPPVLEGYLALSASLDKGALSARERQIVEIAISAENECAYCVAAHSTLADMLRVSPAIVDAIREGGMLPDRKLDALVTFTRSVVRERGHVSDSDVEEFIAAGYTKAQLLEVLGHVGLKVIANYFEPIARQPLDAAFEARAWRSRASQMA